MIYDERIHAVKGKAFRSTLIFAFFLFLVYTALHLTYLFVCVGRVHPLSLLTDGAALLASGIILLVGESEYGSGGDEMRVYEKNCYYAKHFYTFLYIFAGVYCVAAPLAPFAVPYEDYPPSQVLLMALLPCGLFLLWQFKRAEVPLNSSFLEESRGEYWKRVWLNVLKFGGICLGFTLVSFCVTFWYAVSTGLYNPFSFLVLRAVLLAGLAAWNGFALEYLLFSLAERSSNGAKLAGKISGCTRTFLWIGCATSVAGALLTDLSFVLLTRERVILQDVPLGQIAAAFSYITRDFSEVSMVFLSLFCLYFLSELHPLRDRKLETAISWRVFLGVGSSLLSFYLLPMIRSLVLSPAVPAEDMSRRAMQVVSASSYVSFALFAACVVFACLAAGRLKIHGYFSSAEVVWLAVAHLLPSAARLVFESNQSTLFLILEVVCALLPLLIGILWTAVARRIDRRPLLPPDDAPQAPEA